MKPKKKKKLTATMWAISTPKGKILEPLWRHKESAIRYKISEGYHTWFWYYQDGYRVIKVKVTEV